MTASQEKKYLELSLCDCSQEYALIFAKCCQFRATWRKPWRQERRCANVQLLLQVRFINHQTELERATWTSWGPWTAGLSEWGPQIGMFKSPLNYCLVYQSLRANCQAHLPRLMDRRTDSAQVTNREGSGHRLVCPSYI